MHAPRPLPAYSLTLSNTNSQAGGLSIELEAKRFNYYYDSHHLHSTPNSFTFFGRTHIHTILLYVCAYDCLLKEDFAIAFW